MKRSFFLAAGFVATSTLIPTASAAPDLPRVAASHLEGATHLNFAGLDAGVAMRGFYLAFENGDHKLREIELMPSAGRIDAALADHDGRDPFTLEAHYVRLKSMGASSVVKKTNCMAKCTVDMARKPTTGERFVLQGFHFALGANDNNLREIGVRPNPAAGNIDVVFQDNGGKAPYSVEIRYALAPAASFQRIGTTTYHHDGKKPVPVNGIVTHVNGTGMAILQGFDLRFDDGDHHIRQLRVKDVSGYSPKDGTTGATQFQVGFYDNNTDDPWTATIDYAVVTDAAWFQ